MNKTVLHFFVWDPNGSISIEMEFTNEDAIRLFNFYNFSGAIKEDFLARAGSLLPAHRSVRCLHLKSRRFC